MNFNKEAYFKRQTTLTEIGLNGQDLLQKAKVLVIGCGGLGSPIAIYLATSGIGTLHLVDFDTISVSNLHRQVFFKVKDVHQPKVEILAHEIKKRAPFTQVSYTNVAVDKNSILNLISNFDVVVDGTDNLPIKYLINDACVLKKKPLVYGSLYKFDGYVATFNVLNGDGDYTCNLRDAFPEIASDIPSCEVAGTLNPIVGIIALMQVNEVIKLITKTGKLLVNQLLIYNALENSQLKVKLKKNKALIFEDIFRDTNYLDAHCTTQDSALLITGLEFKKKMSDANIEIVSVINNPTTVIPFQVHQTIPHKNFNIDLFIPNFDKTYVLVCEKGIKSYDVTQKIKNKFPDLAVFSLYEGIEKL
jgi:adenylyltransferase/sulfurtransferase